MVRRIDAGPTAGLEQRRRVGRERIGAGPTAEATPRGGLPAAPHPPERGPTPGGSAASRAASKGGDQCGLRRR